MEKLPRQIPWCGERLPALAQKVFFELLKAERRTPTTTLKKDILEKQRNTCVDCGGVFDGQNDIEWDHIVPLRQTVKGQEQKFQAICASCHLEKRF